MFTIVLADTRDVRTVNDPVVAPDGTVIVDTAGTATALLLLDRLTTTPPEGAVHSRTRVAVDVEPPVTGFGESVRVFTRSGRTVNPSAFDTPAYVAVTVPLTFVVTRLVVTVNVCEEAPAGTVTLAGVVAALFVSASDTTAPPLGADPLSTTLPTDVPQPPMTVV